MEFIAPAIYETRSGRKVKVVGFTHGTILRGFLLDDKDKIVGPILWWAIVKTKGKYSNNQEGEYAALYMDYRITKGKLYKEIDTEPELDLVRRFE